MWAPFNGWFASGWRWWKNAMKCPISKGKVRFLWPSPKLISQLTGAPSRNDVSCHGLQNPKSSMESGDTNFAQDICIPAIFVVTLDLHLSVQTNKPYRCRFSGVWGVLSHDLLPGQGLLAGVAAVVEFGFIHPGSETESARTAFKPTPPTPLFLTAKPRPLWIRPSPSDFSAPPGQRRCPNP